MQHKGIAVRGHPNDLVGGERGFLILVEPQDGDAYYLISDRPGRTNQSNEIKLSGWLGTTNNTRREAHGAIEIYRDAGDRLRLRTINAEELLEETTLAGRPTRSTEGAATARLELRMTPAEKNRIRELADAEGVDVSTFVRRRCL